MRILHYIPSIDRSSGGIGSYMQLLSKELGKLVDLHVVTHRSDNELLLENCQLHYISSGWLPWSSSKSEFLTLLSELCPDVFHTNCCWLPLSALTSMWAKNAGYKVVYTPHGMLEPWIMKRNYWVKKLPAIWLFQKKGFAVADMIHSTADLERDNIANLGWNDSISIIPNCVDLEDVDRNLPCDYKYNKRNSENVILFLSRVHEKKGVNFLIEAVAGMKEKLSGWTVLIAGEGEENYIAKLKRMAKDLQVDNLITFIGGVYGAEKWVLYKKAKVFVLPTYCENFGIVITEALACGVPVITTKGTPWEELESFNCGWWTEIGTEPLKNALEAFLEKKADELLMMGCNGRKLVEDKYSSIPVANKFVEMYRMIIY